MVSSDAVSVSIADIIMGAVTAIEHASLKSNYTYWRSLPAQLIVRVCYWVRPRLTQNMIFPVADMLNKKA
jgi:hypothetical protein